jgi:hypothetical protein
MITRRRVYGQTGCLRRACVLIKLNIVTKSPFTITFENGEQAQAMLVPRGSNLESLAEKLDLPAVDGAIVVVGGAAVFDDAEYAAIRAQVYPLLVELARVATEKNLVVVDGGTSCGVMRLLGEARARMGGGFPLLGVAPRGRVRWPGHPADAEAFNEAFNEASNEASNEAVTEAAIPLDANHSAFVLIDGDAWGDESGMLARAGQVLMGDRPGVQVLINGGEISRQDVRAYLASGREVIVIQGSGRLADEFAEAATGGQAATPDMQDMLDSGRVRVFPLESPRGAFTALLQTLFES